MDNPQRPVLPEVRQARNMTEMRVIRMALGGLRRNVNDLIQARRMHLKVVLEFPRPLMSLCRQTAHPLDRGFRRSHAPDCPLLPSMATRTTMLKYNAALTISSTRPLQIHLHCRHLRHYLEFYHSKINNIQHYQDSLHTRR